MKLQKQSLNVKYRPRKEILRAGIRDNKYPAANSESLQQEKGEVNMIHIVPFFRNVIW